MATTSGPTKKTVYIDVDEEITGIIDKVRSTNESIIALVLPKRATVLQSVVNMKLLKRSADQNDKKVVLITSESNLIPLAGAAGLHVAANLQSRPYLPGAPSAKVAEPQPELPIADESDEIDPATPVGSLVNPKQTAADPIEIDNRKKDPIAEASAAAAATKPAKKPKKDKSKMVPDFHKFRALLFIGGGVLIALIIFGYWAFAIAPKATITLRTESSQTKAEAEFAADTSTKELDLTSKILPAKLQEIKKSESEKVAATGEKDNGSKAGGQVTLKNCASDNNKVTVPAGTGISNGNYTFVTQQAVTLSDGNFDSNKNCKSSGDHVGTVNVIAQNNGDQYNLSARTYTVSGMGGIVADGGTMSGGTTKTVKIVSSADVENAKKRITDRQNTIVEEIKTSLKNDGYIGIVDSFTAGTPALSPTPSVGTEATEVVVTGDATYSMLGIKEDDLKKIVEDQSKDKIDTTKQSILNYGFDDATYEVGTKKRTSTDIKVTTNLLAGPEINQDELKSQLAGQKRGDAESELSGRPGITEARVSFKPFWVSKIPGNGAKVNFIIEQADGTEITQ